MGLGCGGLLWQLHCFPGNPPAAQVILTATDGVVLPEVNVIEH